MATEGVIDQKICKKKKGLAHETRKCDELPELGQRKKTERTFFTYLSKARRRGGFKAMSFIGSRLLNKKGTKS